MAFLGSFGKIFQTAVFPIIAPSQITANILTGQDPFKGKALGPLQPGYFGGFSSARPPVSPLAPAADYRVLAAQNIAPSGTAGGSTFTSGSYLTDLYYDQPGYQPGESEYYGGPPSWQTERSFISTPQAMSPIGPSPEMDILTLAQRWLPVGLALLG